MNPPFTALPTTLSAPVTLAGAGVNTDLIQSDRDNSNGFAGLLSELYADLTPTVQEGAAPAPGGEILLAGLQDLPQGGKLLPLLQQTLDGVAASGADLEQFVERLSAGLKTLLRENAGPLTDQSAAEQLAQILQPLVMEQPALRAVLPAEIANALERLSGNADKVDTAELLRTQSNLVQQKTADNGTAPTSAAEPAAARDAGRSFSLDAAMLPQSQQSGIPESRTNGTELAVLMSAIKRLSADTGRPAAAESSVVATSGTAVGTGAVAPASAQGAMPAVALHTPLGQADWDQALGERIQWLASQNVQGAQVKLNPANLGPMEVRIQMHNDQATVHFSSQHAVVRDALEAALPRLRDMFEASGVELVDVDISDGSFTGQQQAMPDHSVPPRGPASAADERETAVADSQQVPLTSFLASGRLDLFA